MLECFGGLPRVECVKTSRHGITRDPVDRLQILTGCFGTGWSFGMDEAKTQDQQRQTDFVYFDHRG